MGFGIEFTIEIKEPMFMRYGPGRSGIVGSFTETRNLENIGTLLPRLFQTFHICSGTSSQLQSRSVLSCKLAPVPTALFDDSGKRKLT